MAAANDVGEQTVRELAELRADGDTVLSLYLDLNPAQFATPRARNSEIDSLLDGAHAVALFVCPPLSLARLLRLPNHVSASWVIADAPFIAPLTPAAMDGRVCVALVDERFARILRGTPEWLVERVSFGDDVHGREKRGGWSQARYQRSQHEEVEAHLRHVARMLYDLLRVAPYDPLMIACTAERWGRVVDKLQPDVRRVLLDERLVLDVSDASIEDVERAAAAPLAERRRARDDDALAELREHIGREDGRAAVGFDAVL